MSNYTAPTFHPDTGKLEQADWMDDYYGRHEYGVRFPDGSVHEAYKCERVGPKAAAEIARLQEEKESGEFWRDVFKDGLADQAKVEANLADYLFMMEQVPKVYSEVTGGLLSKANYYAEVVISEFHEHVNNLCEEAVIEDREG